MESLVKFLEDKITDKMSVEEIVDVFEQMCSTPLEEDMVLFETGTFTEFSKEPFFQISFVRQFSNSDEEFYQIHVVILYKPTAENKIFSETTWDEDLDENIFDYIRKSASFAYARNHEYIEVKTSKKIKFYNSVIEADIFDDALAALLVIPAGKPMLKVTGVTKLEDGTPFNYSCSYNRADKFKVKNSWVGK